MQRELQGMEVALAVLPFFVHAAERRKRPHLCHRIDVIDILAREKLDPGAADVSDLANEADRQLPLYGKAPLSAVQVAAIPLQRARRHAHVAGQSQKWCYGVG